MVRGFYGTRDRSEGDVFKYTMGDVLGYILVAIDGPVLLTVSDIGHVSSIIVKNPDRFLALFLNGIYEALFCLLNLPLNASTLLERNSLKFYVAGPMFQNTPLTPLHRLKLRPFCIV